MAEFYPKLCLGTLEQQYSIKLKPRATPFILASPRGVLIPVLGKVKAELERMERLCVISRVKKSTDLCSVVPVPAQNGICVDLTRLNEASCREEYILQSTEQTLGSLCGAQVFSKLDANRGLWQAPLSPESAKYTIFITAFGQYNFHRLP